MRVLGIDPGSRITGFGVIDVSPAGRPAYVASGCVRVPAGTLAERLKHIYDAVTEVIAAHRPTVMAIEKVFLARNADSALKLGHARGAAICAGNSQGLAMAEYTALQVKRAVVGVGHAEKQQVQHMVKALLKLSGRPQADAADALACAICYAHDAVGRLALARALPARRGDAR